tara:strand:+ start:260 stop:565 length:306 start_codon:yes stop_codon:yes gene_type:complete
MDVWDRELNSWKNKGACVGVEQDIFFPERGSSTRLAKAVCRRCEVQEECLEYAVNNGEKFGIWGGLSERERRAIRKKRGIVLKKKPYTPVAMGRPFKDKQV